MDLKRILLVEDSNNDIELILSVLTEINLAREILVVQDGEQALDYLYQRGNFSQRQPGNPVVVILDLKLPKIDGFEVIQKIKSDPKLKVIPIVVLTSSQQDQDLLKSYDLGINAYVVKPIDFPDFVEVIKKLGVFWGLINHPPLVIPNSHS